MVKAVKELPTPTCEKQIQKLLGTEKYYRKSMRYYVNLTTPISDFVRKHHFDWKAIQEDTFKYLMKTLTFNPVLSLPKVVIPFQVSTKASKFAVGATLQH